MTNKTVAVFNRWFRISVGLFFMGVAVYYKEWMPALFGSIFIIQGILNRGCYGQCFVPEQKHTGRDSVNTLKNS